jgi:L-lactate dehydrogenase
MQQKSCIGIIGLGWVGSSVAMAILRGGAARELLLHDARTAVAEGEAMDLAHGASFYPAAGVRAAALDELHRADVVVVAAGRNSRAGESRLELLRENAGLARELGRAFRDYRGLVVMVTNPVDVLTHVFQKASGLSPERVIGTGTMLDTARLRQHLGGELGVDPRSIHAQVIGEHGDSEVVLWSSADVGGTPLRAWPGWNAEREARIAKDVRTAAYEIIRRKGATNHAIGLVTASLLQSILHDERRVLTVSRVQSGDAGAPEAAFSLAAVVGAGGASLVIRPELDELEREGLRRSVNTLAGAIASVAEAT